MANNQPAVKVDEAADPSLVMTDSKEHVVKKMPMTDKKAKLTNTLLVFAIVIAGIASGWFLSGPSAQSTDEPVIANVTGTQEGATEAGIADTSQFDTEVEGTLEEGGIEGEGTHHLVRNGGPSKNVYLTSGVIDLQAFVGKNVKVWGQTLSGSNAGWLVEAGKITIIK